MPIILTVATVCLCLQANAAKAQCAQPVQKDSAAAWAQAIGKPTMALDDVLKAWGKRRAKTVNLHCQYVMTYTDRVMGKKGVRQQFEAWYAEPDLFRYDWRDADGKLFFILLANGKSVTVYDFAQTFAWEYTRGSVAKGPPHGFFARLGWMMGGGLVEQILDESQLVMLGVTPEEAKTQFGHRLTGESDDYVYLELEPRAGKSYIDNYTNRIVIAFDKKSWVARAVAFDEPNGNQMRFDATKVERNERQDITFESLSKNLPKGWERLRAPEAKMP